MKNYARKRALRLKLTKLVAVASIACLASINAFAADHIDAPQVREDARKDITDVFVFRNPRDPSRLVLAVDYFTPVGAPDSTRLFDSSSEGEYALYIDTDADQVADHTIRARFSNDDGGQQTFRVSGIPGSGTARGEVTVAGEAAKVASKDSALVFAGLRDDPFFFDFEGYTSFLEAPCVPTAGLRCPGTGSPVDFFLGLNVASIVIEFSITDLSNIDSTSSGTINVWAETFSKQN